MGEAPVCALASYSKPSQKQLELPESEHISPHLWGPLRTGPVDGSLGPPAPCLAHHLVLLFLPWTLFIYLFAEPLTSLKGAFVQVDNHQHK